MTLEETLAFIHSTDWKGSRLGLDRTRELLRLLGDPQNKLKFIHVAGTNGKGSVCSMLSSVLAAAGYRTGLYTSPHLMRVNERMVIDGQEITDSALCNLADRTKCAVGSMEESPTEFELITAMALDYFCMQQCDVVVLEVGLGGRLDATNCIPCPEVAVLMNIGLEHTEILGDTLGKIAGEKAGIIKEGGTVVAYAGPEEAVEVFRSVCQERHADLHTADYGQITQPQSGLTGHDFLWQGRLPLHLDLLGEHQLRNAAVALETIMQLRSKGWEISDEQVAAGFAAVRWPARMEILRREPLFLLDGAHNPQCVEAVARSLPACLNGEKAIFLVGVLADKDYPFMMKLLLPFASGFVCLTPESERALPADELADYLRGLGAEAVACVDAESGVKTAVELAKNGAVVALGSLYMAGEIRALF